MKLNEQGVKEKQFWKQAGYELPKYDREKVAQATALAPFWIHFGTGNIFRAFQANVVQRLLNEGVLEQGLITAEGYDYEIIERISRPCDHYSILVSLKADGRVQKTVIGSIVESYVLDADREEEFGRLKDIFTRESLQMASFTITEKGYSIRDGSGQLQKDVAADIKAGPEKPKSYMGKVSALLYERFRKTGSPVAMVSMDNCSHNGDKLKEAVCAFAEGWERNGRIKQGFAEYVRNPEQVSFPWTMIDKITSRPDPSIEKLLNRDGVEGMETVITSRNTYAAPFVNAEECEYLVIEDTFPNGRPELERGGLLFTSREVVEKAERMKVCTCLNPLHTCLAVFGCLLGYTKISEEMKDPELKKLVKLIGCQEGLPVVADPGIIDPGKFLDTVLTLRLPNPFLPDTPQRIATDTSQKLAIRFGETIRAYQEDPKLDAGDLRGIPLVFAGWLRYLTGIDDQGNSFALSPDPLLEELKPYAVQWKMGTVIQERSVRPVLEREDIFGVNLYEADMAGLVLDYLNQMLAGPGAVRDVLKKYTL